MTDFSEITSCLAQAHILPQNDLQRDLGKTAKGGFTAGPRGTRDRGEAFRAEGFRGSVDLYCQLTPDGLMY